MSVLGGKKTMSIEAGVVFAHDDVDDEDKLSPVSLFDYSKYLCEEN